MIQHLRKESRDIGTAGETKEEDVIILIASHQELVTAHDMGIEGAADGRILRFLIPRVESSSPAGMRQVAGVDIGPNARLVVVSIHAITTVKHAVDFENIAIGIGPLAVNK